ncbi:MAG: DUF1926 domain-containing protein [Candidatus Omnitrophica bacterium]|nr:DUF1926 domain-containing protein [Candidatus Omnitrophota bacterium]
MPQKIDLLLAIHSHQPDGNFEWVFAEAYEKSYLPFLESLYRHPRLKAALHYSGCLLDWIAAKHPEFIKMLKEMVGRGQVEMLSGGYYEPILTLIPERDILGQVKLMNEKIRGFTGYRANGVWLTERVWEPTLIKPLAKAGIKFAIVDDWHFTYVGQKPDGLSGYYVTEDEGEKLFIFPGSERLRYMMPFKLPQETIDYMGQQKEKGCSSKIFADDGEKFGVWPGTYKWVYEEKWLENFLGALEKESGWLKTTTFSEYIKENGPTGRIYLTCASYREMMEWSGGYFKNFLVKYPEANSMQKKMQFVSGLVAGAKSKKALEYLYKGQCNCAYWHGVFGGLYLNHLRSAVYSNLIKAQKELDKAAHRDTNWIESVETDLDCDSYDEVLISNSKLELDLSPHNGGTLFELDFKPLALNMTNTLARRREPYHDKALEKAKARDTGKKDGGIDSIHDISRQKDAELVADLSYDSYRRVSLLDHFLKEGTTVKDFSECKYGEAGDFLGGEYKYGIKKEARPKGIAVELTRDGNYYGASGDAYKLRVAKRISVKPDSQDMEIEYKITSLDTREFEPWFGVEFNYSLKDPHLNKAGEAHGLTNINVNDQWYGVKIDFEISKAADLWYFPVETVSDSEQGLERTYQELSVLFHWKFKLAPGAAWGVKITKNIKIEE